MSSKYNELQTKIKEVYAKIAEANVLADSIGQGYQLNFGEQVIEYTPAKVVGTWNVVANWDASNC